MTSRSPRILVTAGPTREPIDAVRYLANRSSGRMGVAIAAEAARRGMPTTLLLGPAAQKPPEGSQITTIRFLTTADLQRLLEACWPEHDVLFMAAAVADYRPLVTTEGKLRRGDEPITLTLEPTPDLLAALAGTTRPDQTVVGFALAEERELIEVAREKLRRKRIDAIVANPLRTMDAATVAATLLLADGRSLDAAGELGKAEFARWLLDRLPDIRGRPVDDEDLQA